MASRNAVELESTINARLYYITTQCLTGDDVEGRLRAIAEVTLSSLMWELIGNNSIPANLVKGAAHDWAAEMLKLAEVKIAPNERPQIQFNVRKMTEKIFQGQQGRAAIASIISGHRARGTLMDEELSLELERRGLEQVITPKGAILKTGRARIADEVQKSVAELEIRRTKELEVQRQKDKEQKEIEDNGFGRKVDWE